MFRKQTLLLQDPKITYPIYDLRQSFPDYVIQCKQIISQYRLDLDHHPDITIQANCPFEYRPKDTPKPRYGALLIHGLFDSPFVMQEIGKQLAADGLLVRSILLPGHGTVPGALLNVTCEEWIQSVQYGISTFKDEVDGLFLVGFSTGGALACYQAAHPSSTPPIKGLVLLAPVFKIKSKFAFLAQSINLIGNYWHRAKWLTIRPEVDYAKYVSIPFNAVYQVECLTKKIKTTLRLPQWIALSINDDTVSSRASLNYFSNQTNTENHMTLYAPKKIKQSAPYMTIREPFNIAHIGLPISPANPHYGKQGDCPIPKRIAFNPDFDFLMKDMKKFISVVSSDSSLHPTIS